LAKGYAMAEAAIRRPELLKQLRAIITEILELEPDELTETGDFVDDYDADSLLGIAIVARIDRDLGVAIPPADLPDMVNLSAVLEIVERYAGSNDLEP
jgi:acyl carrier protein